MPEPGHRTAAISGVRRAVVRGAGQLGPLAVAGLTVSLALIWLVAR